MTTMTMMTRLQSTIKLLAALQLAIFALWAYSYAFFINFEVAFLSAAAVMMGSMLSYGNLVKARIAEYEATDEKDLVARIDDPYDLYDEEETTEHASETETADLRSVVREEKKRLKGKGGASLKKSAPAVVSLYRVVPYLFLVLGFVGLQNNALLSLWPYLSGLAVGIAAGFFAGRRLFISES